MREQQQQVRQWHEHGAFYDVQAALGSIARAKDAMQGIGALLYSSAAHLDVQLNEVHCSQVAAIFSFFGESLIEPVEHAYEANDRLQQDLLRDRAQPEPSTQAVPESMNVIRHPNMAES